MPEVGRCKGCGERIDATHRPTCPASKRPHHHVVRADTHLAGSDQHETKPCRSCKRPVVWAVSTKGKPMPIDAKPVAGGNLVLDDVKGGGLLARMAGLMDDADGPRYVTHFATCPDHEKWRKG